MNLVIQNKKENLLLQRREVSGTISFDKTTPSNNQLIELLVKEYSAASGCVVIRSINTLFGQRCARFQADIYNSEDLRRSTEKITLHKRKKLEEEAKKATA